MPVEVECKIDGKTVTSVCCEPGPCEPLPCPFETDTALVEDPSECSDPDGATGVGCNLFCCPAEMEKGKKDKKEKY